jgi:hypothetical protein
MSDRLSFPLILTFSRGEKGLSPKAIFAMILKKKLGVLCDLAVHFSFGRTKVLPQHMEAPAGL